VHVKILLRQLSPDSLPRNQKSDGDEKVPHPKYNLMEETYGKKWAKKSKDKYFSPDNCTEGNQNFITLFSSICRFVIVI
jgi:hypothetical protein